MDFLSTASEIVALLTSTLGLIGTAVGAYFAIKNWIKAFKDKKAQEVWGLIMEMADAAMKEAERTGAAGADKKAMVVESIKASAKAANLEIDGFIEQLGDYIDQTIDFVNAMKKKQTKKTSN